MHFHQYTNSAADISHAHGDGGGAQARYLGAEGGATAHTGCQFMTGDKQPFSLAAWNTVASNAIVFPDSEIAAAQQQLVRKSPGM